MKNFIYKTNNYLLENYPTLWNTKVLWMLGISAIIHFVFFLFGIGTFTNPEALQNSYAIDIFFKNGMMLFSIMVSVILIVTWLILMFKNNAFKNFYPTNKLDLFKQFTLYFIIILASITFYYSYTAGVNTYISLTYKDTEMSQDIALANKSAPFFSHNINSYTIENTNYPEPLNTLYCSVNTKTSVGKNINYSKTYYNFLDKDYQFYNLTSKTINNQDIYNTDVKGNVYSKKNDSTTVFYFKDEVQDVSKYLKTIEPSYFNYSKLFYFYGNENYNSYYKHHERTYYDKLTKHKFDEKEVLFTLNKARYKLLERNNPDEIRAILKNFLELSKKYRIKHNLNDDIWFSLIYNPKKFKLKHIINDTTHFKENIDIAYDNELTPFEQLYVKLKTDYFIDSDALHTVFENIDEIKSEPIISAEIHLFLWISFTLSILILLFRLTGLKALLFSVITTGLLIVFIALVSVLLNYTNLINHNMEYFVLYFIFLVGTLILIVSLFYITKIKKQIAAIFVNITLAGFVPYLFLICGIITTHQSDNCRKLYNDYSLRKENCFELLDLFSPFVWSFIFLTIGFVFVFFFSKQILNWKAMPEG